MKKLLSFLLLVAVCVSALSVFTGCRKKGGAENPDALVIMTEQPDGLFNPFFSTSAADGTIVSMTQIGMLSSQCVYNADGTVQSVIVSFGENEAVATLDYELTKNEDGDSVYTFVIKKDILFSDGHPLTIEDVLFNLYVYLDPVYTGSATIYSTAIKGLNAYKEQNPDASDDDDNTDRQEQASANASARRQELVDLFNNLSDGAGDLTISVTSQMMYDAIATHSPSYGYMSAIMTDAEMSEPDAEDKARAQLKKDYDNVLKLFKEELNNDFAVAKESYVEAPYNGFDVFKDEVFCFFAYEGYVDIEYKGHGTASIDRTVIEKITQNYPESITTKEAAIDRVFKDMTEASLPAVLNYSVSASTIINEYVAKAKEVLLNNELVDGELAVPSVSGIESLGHKEATMGTTITVNGNQYTVASTHDENGVPTDGYDVLRITLDGVDPKAQWNFAFSVAPQHYYGEGAETPVDIKNNKFGVDFNSFDFMMDVVQSVRNNTVPMGAGPYKATNRANGDNPSGTDFYSAGIAYFKRNDNFYTVGSGLYNAKIEKVRYQVVTASNAIGALKEGSVHYVTPQLTKDNAQKLAAMQSEGFNYIMTDQLGYGYIGVNATHIPDINLRKAIMCAMNTTLALDYYTADSAEQIYWPMSKVSWAYPDGNYEYRNGKDYPQMNGQWNEQIARNNIQKYMSLAGVSAGDEQLKIKFTIAGSNLQEHPTYKVFRDAANLLNSMGWDITVEADIQALTKINTGALAVWAAAWGSTIDPDMYQIYHKNSTATSTKGWGYDEIKRDDEQARILNELSELIDEARDIPAELTTDAEIQSYREEKYLEAMGLVLDLAIELPVYQRSTVYAYNANVIKASSLPSEVNPYTSPLDRIWELEFAN